MGPLEIPEIAIDRSNGGPEGAPMTLLTPACACAHPRPSTRDWEWSGMEATIGVDCLGARPRPPTPARPQAPTRHSMRCVWGALPSNGTARPPQRVAVARAELLHKTAPVLCDPGFRLGRASPRLGGGGGGCSARRGCGGPGWQGRQRIRLAYPLPHHASRWPWAQRPGPARLFVDPAQ